MQFLGTGEGPEDLVAFSQEAFETRSWLWSNAARGRDRRPDCVALRCDLPALGPDPIRLPFRVESVHWCRLLVLNSRKSLPGGLFNGEGKD